MPAVTGMAAIIQPHLNMGLGSLIFLIVMLALLVAAGVFVVRADTQVEALPNYSSDTNLQSAHTKLKHASVTVWVGFAGIVVLILLYMFLGSETAEFTGGLVITLFLFLTIFLCILVGIFAIQALQYLKKSSNYTSSSSSAGRDIGIAIGLTIGVIGLLFILFLIEVFSRMGKKKPATPAQPAPQATLPPST